MTQLFFNNIKTDLTVALSGGALSMTVADATGLPTSVTAGDFYLLTLSDGPVETKWEVIRIEAGRTGNVIPIFARGQEGTSDVAWAIDDFVSARVTAATMDEAHNHGGGGGGGAGTSLEFDNDIVHATVQGFNFSGYFPYSSDGGWSWKGDRVETILGLAGGDADTPRFVRGTGHNQMPGMCVDASSFI